MIDSPVRDSNWKISVIFHCALLNSPTFHSLEIAKASCVYGKIVGKLGGGGRDSQQNLQKIGFTLKHSSIWQSLAEGKLISVRTFLWQSSTNFGRHGWQWKKTSHDRSDVPWARAGSLLFTRIDWLYWTWLYKTQKSCVQFRLTNVEESAELRAGTEVQH